MVPIINPHAFCSEISMAAKYTKSKARSHNCMFPKNHCRKGNSEEWGGRGEVGVEGEARTINIGVNKHTGL